MTEKIFVHVNLLLSLVLGDLAYFLDTKFFTNRMELPVSKRFYSSVQTYHIKLYIFLFLTVFIFHVNIF